VLNKFVVERKEFAVRLKNHPGLSKLWRSTKWATNWSGPLKRTEAYQDSKVVRVLGVPKRCLILNLEKMDLKTD